MNSSKKPYTIVIPPPNVTGQLTMGHILNNTLQDILIRFEKLNGRETCWLPGTDHAGIATQTKVEKELKKNEGLTRYDLGREKFLERVWAWKEQYGGKIIKQLRSLGTSHVFPILQSIDDGLPDFGGLLGGIRQNVSRSDTGLLAGVGGGSEIKRGESFAEHGNVVQTA